MGKSFVLVCLYLYSTNPNGLDALVLNSLDQQMGLTGFNGVYGYW